MRSASSVERIDRAFFVSSGHLTDAMPTASFRLLVFTAGEQLARNYLLPYGLATVATEANKRRVEKHRAAQASVRAGKLKTLQELANTVSKYSVTLEANATPEGHLYGSILAADISKALKSASYPVEPDNIRLEGPLKELGMYTVKLHFAPEVEAEVKVWVVPTAAAANAAKA